MLLDMELWKQFPWNWLLKQTNLSPCKSVKHASNAHQSAGATNSKSHSRSQLKREESVCNELENEQFQLE